MSPIQVLRDKSQLSREHWSISSVDVFGVLVQQFRTHQSINCYRSHCNPPHLNPKCCDRTFVKNSKNKVKRYRGTYLTDDWRRILNHFAEFVVDTMKGSILFFLPFAKCGDFLCRLFEWLVHALILRQKFELMRRFAQSSRCWSMVMRDWLLWQKLSTIQGNNLQKLCYAT